LQIAEDDIAALERIKAAGVTVVATTGRPFPGALPWAQRLGLDGPMIVYQGAEVRLPDGRKLFDEGVRHDLAMEVVRYARERDLHVQAYRDDELLVERDRPEAHEYADHAGMKINFVADLDDGMGPTTPKLVIIADADLLERMLPEVRERWRGRLNAATSVPRYLEFTSIDSDKSHALRFLSARLDVPQSAIAAAGDGRNDASMLEWAALGVAVEGAPSEVLQAARNVTMPPPGHGGIARLAELLLK
jgi:Cof subfamily protein (haloacid dehalogenase superfamily)